MTVVTLRENQVTLRDKLVAVTLRENQATVTLRVTVTTATLVTVTASSPTSRRQSPSG